jgi:thiamine-monophosphate kinase
MPSGEHELIARYFKPLATAPGALALTDDAASFAPPEGHELVLTADAIVSGIHFLPDDPAETVARKALRVNLSDLAAKGAHPAGCLLTLALPDGFGEE